MSNATFYVRKTGNDSTGNGQTTNPWLTIKHALAQITGTGNTVIVGNGTYNERLRDVIISGAAGAPNTLQAENRNLAIVKPNDSSLGDSWFYAIEISGVRSYITIDGIFADASLTTGPAYQIGRDSGVISNIIIKNGTATGANPDPVSGEGAIGIAAGNHSNSSQTAFTISNMDIYSNISTVIAGYSGYGIYLIANGCTVEGNRIHDNSGLGIHAYDFAANVNNNIIRNNVIYNNGTAGIATDDGILLANGSNNLVYNNIIYGNTGSGIRSGFTSNDNSIYNNTIYNNVGYGVNIDNAFSPAGYPLRIIARNNIVYLNSLGATRDTGTTSTINTNLSTDPTFVNAAAADFTLQSGSGAIDQGADLSSIFTTDFSGQSRIVPWEIGAYEFGGQATYFFPIDDFDYTTGADLVSQNGGQGWAAAWTNIGTGQMTIQVGPAGASGGGNAVRSQTTTGTTDYRRAFNPVSTGIIRFYQRISAVPSSGAYVGAYFTHTSVGEYSVEFFSDGNIVAFGAAGNTVLSAFSINTWYLVEIQLDAINQPGMFRVRIDGGTWSSWLAVLSSAPPVDGFGVEDLSTSAHTFWLDAIGVPSTVVNVTGFGLTASLGTVSTTATARVTLTGVSGTSHVGTVGVSSGVNVTGVSGTGAVGTVTVHTGDTFSVTGVSATANVGSVTITTTTSSGATISISGLTSTASVGTVTVTTGSGVTVNVTGVSSIASVGSVTLQVSDVTVNVTGVSSVSSVGSLSVVTPSPANPHANQRSKNKIKATVVEKTKILHSIESI